MAAPFIVVAALGVLSTASGDWARFRGPNGTGVSATNGLPETLDPKGNLLWRVAVGGQSSPVVFGDRIFLTAEDDEALFVMSLESATGKEVWRVKAPRDRVTKVDTRNSASSPTPAVDADVIAVFFPDFGLLAYDHDGKELWRRPLGPFKNVYGMGASPVLVGDRVVLACDQNRASFVIAVSKASGEVLWRTERPHAKSGHCTPVVYRPSGEKAEIILPGSFYLDAYDALTGERTWWVGGLCFEMKSVPVLDDGVVYINGYGSPLNQPGNQVEVADFDDALKANDSDGDGQVSQAEMPASRAANWFSFMDLDGDKKLNREEWGYLQAALRSQNGMLAIRAGGEGDCTKTNLVWSHRKSVPQLPSPLVYDGVLYMLNDQGGLITTFRAETGEVITRGRLKAAVDNYYASPVAGDGKIYIVSESGIVTILPPGGGLEALSITELDETCHATPALADGRVYLRSMEALYCFGATD